MAGESRQRKIRRAKNFLGTIPNDPLRRRHR
jgi:hypothetical protein